MCNNNNGSSDGNCISELLKVIQILQQSACGDSTLDSCDRPMLGGGNNCLVCNTRPVMLYTCCGNGVPISMPVCKDSNVICSNPDGTNVSTECSNVFRVEKVDGNCCTFRVLAANPDQTCCNSQPWIATNSLFTMNLDCACIVRCLSDCYVDCVC